MTIDKPAPSRAIPAAPALVSGGLPSILAALLIAVAIFALFGKGTLGFDAYYAFIWGDDVAQGRAPDYDAANAPVGHPLSTAIGAVAAPFGDAGPQVMRGMVLLSVGALAVGVFHLGRVAYGLPVALLGAAIIATRAPVLRLGSFGMADLVFAALVVWAAVLEARRPRRGAAVLVLLALAGLQRPEGWIFAGVYWLWVAPPLDWPARLRLALLVAAGPLLWTLSYLVLTGDPFRGVEEAGAPGKLLIASALPVARSVPDRVLGAPEHLLDQLGGVLQAAESGAAILGLAAALIWLRHRSWVPLALAVVNGAALFLYRLLALPVTDRFMFPAAAMLAIFAAIAVLGWTALERDHPARRWWQVGGALVLVGIAAFVPRHVDRLAGVRDEMKLHAQIESDLRDLVEEPAAGPALRRCGEVYVAQKFSVPPLAHWSGIRAEEIVPLEIEDPGPKGVFLVPATGEVARATALTKKGKSLRRISAEIPRNYRMVAANRSWVLYSSCPRAV